MNVQLDISKEDVMREVFRQTAYLGAKTPTDDGNAYDAYSATSDDRELLERYWRETVSVTADQLKRFITNITPTDGGTPTEKISISLTMPPRFDNTLTPTIQDALFSFFVNSIIGKWIAMLDKDKAALRSADAANSMTEALRKLYHQKPPTR